MKKSTLKLTVTAIVVVLLIVAGTILSFISSSDKSPVEQVASKQEVNHTELIVQKQNNDKQKDKTVGYEKLYLEYVKNNTEYFTKGVILCDLNDDSIPELFSVENNSESKKDNYMGYDFLFYHELKDGVVIHPTDSSIKSCLRVNDLMQPNTFFEDTYQFFGIYRNTTTGKKALINHTECNNDMFDVISFEENRLVLNLEDVLCTDEVMGNYRLVQGEWYAAYVFENTIEDTLQTLIDDFKAKNRQVKYDNTSDGKIECHIRDVDLEKNEIELVPVSYITYDEYIDAINSDKKYFLNGHEYDIYIDEYDYTEFGTVYLRREPDIVYGFECPSEEYPVSEIGNYFGNIPIKVKFSNDMKIKFSYRTQDYEGKNEYNVREYFSDFSEYMDGLYKAFIKNNKLIYLEHIYHE